MEYLFIYGLQMANIIEGILFFTTFGAVVLTVTTIIASGVYHNEITSDDNLHKDIKNTFKTLKKTAIALVIISILMSLLPTKQTLLLMGGTYLGKKAVNEVVQSDKTEKVNTIIDLQLEKYIKDLQRESTNANR